jgi:hypothetical protein
VSSHFRFAINSAVAKLTKYYCMISNDGLAISVVLDPRFKLKVYDKTQDTEVLKNAARLAVTYAYNEYKIDAVAVAEESQPPKKKCKWEDESIATMTELDVYLAEPCIAYDVDVLFYWKSVQNRFLTLAKMAQD